MAYSDKRVFVSLADVKEHLSSNGESGEPWQIPSMPSPLPDAVLPSFLHGLNASLLRDVKNALQAATEPSAAAFEQLAMLHHKLHYLLLLERGAMTRPQQAGCGLGTWLTCQQGALGFGWLSHPTSLQLEQWAVDPGAVPEGTQWHFKALQRGETVYFGPGTVYFLITLPGRDSLALAVAGHVLRRCDLVRYAEVLLQQVQAAADRFKHSKMSTPPPLPFPTESGILSVLASSVTEKLAELAVTAGKSHREDEYGGHFAIKKFQSNVVRVRELIAEVTSPRTVMKREII